jgi:purine-binding chemotaxis protein CheW
VSSAHLRVRVGAEQYALAADDVLEVAVLGEVIPVPGAPPGVLGVRNLRGLVLPVIDLGQVLGAPGNGDLAGLVVGERDGRRAGLAVTALGDVAALPEISEPAASLYLQGAVWVDESLVGIVDVGAVLTAIVTAEARHDG